MGISGATARLLPVIAVTVGLLVGCSGPAEDEGASADEVADAAADAVAEAEADSSADEAPVEEPDESTATGKPDPRARAVLKAAILELLSANTARVDLEIPLGAGASIRERGTYRISPLAYDIVRELTSPEATMVVAQRTAGDQQWVRLESVTTDQGDTEGWPCWVSSADVARIPGSPLAELPGPDGQPPAAVVAASYGIGRERRGPGAVAGTTDLALALSLLGAKALLASGVDPQGDATVPAAFTLVGGKLAEVAVRLDELPDAVEAAGGTLPPELDELAEAPGVMRTRFTEVGKAVDLAAPAPGEQLVLADPDKFEAAMASCGKR
jgi:hypothetical protein